MKRKEFEEVVDQLFTTKVKGKDYKASSQIKTCLAIFREDNQWVSEDAVGEIIYGKPKKEDRGSHIEAVRKNVSRIKEKLKKTFSEPDRKLRGCRISLAENEKKYGEGVPKDSRRREVKFFRFEFLTEKDVKPREGVKSYLRRFVGRTEEIGTFQNLIDNLYSPQRIHHILSLYGFGGIGKSTLLTIFRDVATAQKIHVMPRHPRDEFVSKTFSSWVSDVFVVPENKPKKFHEEKWRDFLEMLDPGTVVLVDTLATVDMQEFDETLQSLSAVLRRANPECLIVTATRTKPRHTERNIEVRGLTPEDIKSLVAVRGWSKEIASHANKLQKHTDGNPLMIECICEDENLWTRFREGSLDLIRHSDPVAFLLKEMWELLTQQGKESLKTAALLSRYANKWKFRWGKDECSGLLGSSWDDTFSELKGKCFIREKDVDVYEMHELISDFAISKIMNKAEEMIKIGDYFSQKGREEIALRFHTEASDAK
jgi:hypothetical protein